MTTSYPCSTCGHPNRPEAKFCPKCGTRLDSPTGSPVSTASNVRRPEENEASHIAPVAVTTCATCKREVEPGTLFCRHCGAARQPTSVPDGKRDAQPPISAPPPAAANSYMPTLPLPARLPPQVVEPAAQPVPAVPSPSSVGIAKTRMMKGPASPLPVALPVAAPYQLEPTRPQRLALPGWLWFLLGLLIGVLGTVTIVQYGATMINFFR